MPFDIDRTRRWVITYELKEEALDAEIKDARTKIAAAFVAALKGYLSIAFNPEPFNETRAQIAPGLFFADGDVLANPAQ